jgi:hypothetical protein
MTVDRQNVIARLRASRQGGTQTRLEAGRSAGSEWGADEAEYTQLYRLAESRREKEIADPETFIDAIDPDRWITDGEWLEFWGERAGSELTGSFIIGFVEGAVSVFNNIVNEP